LQGVWDLRQHPRVVKVFQEIYNEVDVLTSMESFCFFSRHQVASRTASWPLVSLFKDRCVQSLVNLIDCTNERDGCFVCWDRSHKEHKELLAKCVTEEEKRWYKFELEQISHLTRVNVRARKGDMILWFAQTICQNMPPDYCKDNEFNSPDAPRDHAVVYISMMPRRTATQRDLDMREAAWRTLRGTWYRAAGGQVGLRPATLGVGSEEQKKIFEEKSPLMVVPHAKLTPLGHAILGL
jgi:hypothetical protein